MPEIAIAGRSNVGKSTLINMLLNRTSHRIAKVGSKPGKTRSLNFFRIDATEGGRTFQFTLVDLPGYGYAKGNIEERVHWRRLIDCYFSSDRDIPFIIHLIDFRHGPLSADVELIEWLDAMNMPRFVIFTKGDKLPRGRAKEAYRKYTSDSRLASIAPPLVTTGKNDVEAERLRALIPRIISDLKSFNRALTGR
jgi:GTP-binding protein